MKNKFSSTHVLVILSVLTSIATADLIDHELSLAISALRSRGYNLFPHAITNSVLRLRLRLLSSRNHTFTLFSPPDSLLLSLGFSFTAIEYDRSLLCHVSPSRLTAWQLQNLTYLNTLLPQHRLQIGGTIDSVTVDGVRLSLPDLFVGSIIAVHGLEGLLLAEVESDEEDEESIGQLGFVSKPVDELADSRESTSLRNRRRFRRGFNGDDKVGHGKFSKFNHRHRFVV